jgi:hypothetical protein
LIEETGAGRSARTAIGLLCGLWFSLLLVLRPSSDWIGLLALSQALFAAACLIRNSAAKTQRSDRAAETAGENGEDHAN